MLDLQETLEPQNNPLSGVHLSCRNNRNDSSVYLAQAEEEGGRPTMTGGDKVTVTISKSELDKVLAALDRIDKNIRGDNDEN